MLSRLLTAKYMLRQKTDMFIYGEKCVKRIGVSDEILNEITPFRRLSNKPVSLSDPQYFISNFEKERGNKYLPIKWEDMNDEEKIDYIVHERYSQLVANKIMNKIAPEQVEHSYTLNAQGDIISHDIGDSNSVMPDNKIKWAELVLKSGNKKPLHLKGIHNHPENRDIVYYVDEFRSDKKDSFGCTFSGGDIYNYISWNEIGYVVDAFGHKYKYIPNTINYCNNKIAEIICNFIKNNLDKAIQKLSHLSEKINKLSRDLDEYVEIEGFDNKAMCMFEEYLQNKSDYYINSKINLDAQKDLIYATSDYGKLIQLS